MLESARSPVAPGRAERVPRPRAWPASLPGFLVLSVLGAALVISVSLHQVARSLEERARQAHLERAVGAFELLLTGRATALQETLSQIAIDPALERALLDGTPEALERFISARLPASALDALRVMTSGTPAVTGAVLRDGAFPPTVCDRAHVDGALVHDPPRSGVLLVATRDRTTAAGIPVRVCGAVDLAAAHHLAQVSQVTGTRAFVRTRAAPLGAPGVSANPAERIRSVRVGGDEITVGVAHIEETASGAAWLATHARVAMPFVVAIAILMILRGLHVARGERERVHGLCESVADGVLIVDESEHVIRVNEAAARILAVAPDEAIARWLPDLIDVREEDGGRTLVPDLLSTLRSGTLGRTFEGELVRADGSRAPVTLSARWLGADGSGLVVLNPTSEERATKRVATEAAAVRDPVSGALTKQAFGERLAQALGVAATQGDVFSVLKLEIDGADGTAQGWSRGTEQRLVLELVAVLNSGLRASDLLARLAPARFAVLLPGCGREDALGVAESLRSKVRQFRFVDGGRMYEFGISVGAVQAGAGFDDVDALLDAVDVACERARAEGRNRIHVYQHPLRRGDQGESDLECAQGIRHALEHGRFELFAQPLAPLACGARRTQLEVLLRMRAEDGSHVAPVAFLPAAERHRLAGELDAHVVSLLFERHTQFLVGVPFGDSEGRAFDLTINVSAASVQSSGFVGDLEARMRSAGVERGRLGVEISEATALADIDAARRFIEAMRRVGCAVILDDFGSGASSLSRLRGLAVDFVKLDGSLVRDVVRDPVDRAMVKAVCEVAGSLDIRVIAEHIQSCEALEIMRTLGVDLVQGFVVAPPGPLADFAERSATHRDPGPVQASPSDVDTPVLELRRSARMH